MKDKGKPAGPVVMPEPLVSLVFLVLGKNEGSGREWILEAHLSKADACARVENIDALRQELRRSKNIVGIGQLGEDPGGWLAAYRKRAGDNEFSAFSRYAVKAVPLVGAPERATGPAADVARSVMAWWEKHQHDVTGDYGEYNVYHSEPEFVAEARTILGLPE